MKNVKILSNISKKKEEMKKEEREKEEREKE